MRRRVCAAAQTRGQAGKTAEVQGPARLAAQLALERRSMYLQIDASMQPPAAARGATQKQPCAHAPGPCRSTSRAACRARCLALERWRRVRTLPAHTVTTSALSCLNASSSHLAGVLACPPPFGVASRSGASVSLPPSQELDPWCLPSSLPPSRAPSRRCRTSLVRCEPFSCAARGLGLALRALPQWAEMSWGQHVVPPAAVCLACWASS